MLRSHILPELLTSPSLSIDGLRAWSAGCSTGEEAYTLAVIMHEQVGQNASLRTRILGTDINADALDVARKGVYRTWSFRGTEPSFRADYFTDTGDDRSRLIEDIHGMVTFDYLNLARDGYPSLLNGTVGLDLVVCRNVLMYFAPEILNAVIRKLVGSLRPGGWLIVSSVEVPLVRHIEENLPLIAVAFSGATAFKRRPFSWNQDPPVSQAIPLEPKPQSIKREAIATKAGEPTPMAKLEVRRPVDTGDLVATAEGRYASGDYLAVVRAIMPIFEYRPGDERVAELLVKSLSNLGRLEEAARCCRRAIDAERLNPTLRYLLAAVLLEQQRFDEAGEGLRQVVYADPDFILAHFLLGRLSARRGRHKTAARHFRHTLALLALVSGDQPVPHTDGMTAQRLAEIVRTNMRIAGESDE